MTDEISSFALIGRVYSRVRNNGIFINETGVGTVRAWSGINFLYFITPLGTLEKSHVSKK